MNQNFSDSIILITSTDTTDYGGNFGTGFVIHQDEHITYVLTCAHVVEEVGGVGRVKVGGYPAKEEVASGNRQGCDLAVLAVEDGLTKLPSLKLGVVAEKGREFIASGCYTDGTKTRKLASISGKLGGTQIILEESDRTPAWNLEISNDSEHDLKAGYSGSPVVDKASGYVLGVVAQLTGQGKGVAISIEALGKIWQGKGMPQNLISKPSAEKIKSGGSMTPAMQRKIERLKRELNLAEKQSKELQELIELIDVEINEHRDDLTRQRMLNQKKERYERELQPHELKVETLLTEIDELTQE
ncbi:hypothetical protein DSM106972_092920 [Dulcicalothrix desertica PCC 7102]|uniref:Serine protease n=1 Tax=Dulcicalothrix desertica PCC 7102 TaxID=232991 RepID=A0A3S1BTJ4_9CYAN|nr:serine protease [Dulcicalothrix desertica]RUS94655.1 hypothetical protein DSM106972_092920 [Dulcicalothrix desertica PCC 7102]TWH62549.1 trypsin-like peptidase [Dulcicalothrix desertica PCC 7102]